MVRATAKMFDQDDDDSDAGIFEPAGTKNKEAGAAKGSAAQQGADGAARKAQMSKQTVLDPSDPRPRTGYSHFVEERKHEVQRQREHSGRPQLSKEELAELQKATKEQWESHEHAPRKRELEAQHRAAVGQWSKRQQKPRQPAKVSPEGFATPVPA